jgi:NAD+ synthase (glutamine-hydrolysing)
VNTSPGLTVALAQLNPTVGDTEGNARLAAEWIDRAREAGAQLVVLPELCIPGYPPEDLLLRADFLASNVQALRSVASGVEGIVALVGFAEPAEGSGDGADARAYNSIAVLAGGEVRGVYRKMHLPNYGVFDEQRYFQPGTVPALVEVDGVMTGLTICEDCWVPGPPETIEADAGARLTVNASASPYHRGKGAQREAMIAERAREAGAPIALCNTAGGQDELVFDGQSLIVSAEGETLARGVQFAEQLVVATLELPPREPKRSDVEVLARIESGAKPVDEPVAPMLAEPLEPEQEVYEALCLGLHDYVEKNGFEGVVLALSGGIDSALVALIAVDALGPESVRCVSMPSPHSSEDTRRDARRIAEALGVELLEIPISEAMEAYESALAERFDGTEPGQAEENIQARIRGNLVMALSNKFGWLVLTTGNKSEMSVGYATLYGDMAGGFAVIKDVPKTLVYRLVRWRNEREGRELVPDSVLERAPSAELRPDQRDEDSLPLYELLDQVLEAYVEGDQSPDEIVSRGLPERIVREVVRMVDRAEYKRRQAPPGVKITPKAFGRDRRLPITNRFGPMTRPPR